MSFPITKPLSGPRSHVNYANLFRLAVVKCWFSSIGTLHDGTLFDICHKNHEEGIVYILLFVFYAESTNLLVDLGKDPVEETHMSVTVFVCMFA